MEYPCCSRYVLLDCASSLYRITWMFVRPTVGQREAILGLSLASEFRWAVHGPGVDMVLLGGRGVRFLRGTRVC